MGSATASPEAHERLSSTEPVRASAPALNRRAFIPAHRGASAAFVEPTHRRSRHRDSRRMSDCSGFSLPLCASNVRRARPANPTATHCRLALSLISTLRSLTSFSSFPTRDASRRPLNELGQLKKATTWSMLTEHRLFERYRA